MRKRGLRISVFLMAIAVMVLWSACADPGDAPQVYARAEVYDASSGELIRVIDDKDALAGLSRELAAVDLPTSSERPEAKEAVRIAVYKVPAARITDAALELVLRITTYEGVCDVKYEVSPGAVKSVKVDQGVLTFYGEVSEGTVAYLNGLAESGE